MAIIDIKSIADLHEIAGLGKPTHPLVAAIEMTGVRQPTPSNSSYRLGCYSILCKQYIGQLKYGQSYYDFGEGSLMFTAPGQVMTPSPGDYVEQGWGLFFHPDLINNSSLGRKIIDCSFFHYATNEALFVTEEEKQILTTCFDNIRKEYSQRIDKHTNSLIQSNIALLLDYCTRFYDRQFYTHEKVNTDMVQQFEKLLKDYFAQEHTALPGVAYFAKQLHLSPNYLSDLLQRFTGKTTQEHIHLQVVDMAKSLLWSTEKNISEIAYSLGFEHASHFTRLFKQKTGYAPSEYRRLN